MRRFVDSRSDCFDMPNLRFTGKILPAKASITINFHPTMHWESTEFGIRSEIMVEIKESIISVTCNLDKFDAKVHMQPLLKRVDDAVRGFVDLVAFSTGRGLVTVIEQFIDDSGRRSDIVFVDHRLAALATSVAKSEDFAEVLMAVLLNPPLGLALRDLNDSLCHFHRSPTSCARAVR
jgi:hypothetical protein